MSTFLQTFFQQKAPDSRIHLFLSIFFSHDFWAKMSQHQREKREHKLSAKFNRLASNHQLSPILAKLKTTTFWKEQFSSYWNVKRWIMRTNFSNVKKFDLASFGRIGMLLLKYNNNFSSIPTKCFECYKYNINTRDIMVPLVFEYFNSP